MTITTFHFHSTPMGRPKVMTLNAIDVAARYFVYKLYEATDGQPMQWATLRGMDESRATVARAIERGWVILQPRIAAPGVGGTVGTQGRVNRRRAAAGAQGDITSHEIVATLERGRKAALASMPGTEQLSARP
jgi:hypothetical protein